jgi:hypothetical protein
LCAFVGGKLLKKEKTSVGLTLHLTYDQYRSEDSSFLLTACRITNYLLGKNAAEPCR